MASVMEKKITLFANFYLFFFEFVWTDEQNIAYNI